jgi:hypothetical protein
VTFDFRKLPKRLLPPVEVKSKGTSGTISWRSTNKHLVAYQVRCRSVDKAGKKNEPVTKTITASEVDDQYFATIDCERRTPTYHVTIAGVNSYGTGLESTALVIDANAHVQTLSPVTVRPAEIPMKSSSGSRIGASWLHLLIVCIVAFYRQLPLS